MEEFFGPQRSRGGHNDNPTVKQFLENTVSLRIQKSAALAPGLYGETAGRGSVSESLTYYYDTPLKKRERQRRKSTYNILQ